MLEVFKICTEEEINKQIKKKKKKMKKKMRSVKTLGVILQAFMSI